MIQKGGKTYYIFPDPAQNQAYVGGPKQYRHYQELRTTNKLAQENLETAEVYQDSAMEWRLGRRYGSLGTHGRAGSVLIQVVDVAAAVVESHYQGGSLGPYLLVAEVR